MFCCSMGNWEVSASAGLGDVSIGLRRGAEGNYNPYKFVVFTQNVCVSDVQIYIITATSYSQN